MVPNLDVYVTFHEAQTNSLILSEYEAMSMRSIWSLHQCVRTHTGQHVAADMLRNTPVKSPVQSQTLQYSSDLCLMSALIPHWLTCHS